MIGYALQTKKSDYDFLLSYHWKIFKVKSYLFDTLYDNMAKVGSTKLHNLSIKYYSVYILHFIVPYSYI
jgi:hypothetical protein